MKIEIDDTARTAMLKLLGRTPRTMLTDAENNALVDLEETLAGGVPEVGGESVDEQVVREWEAGQREPAETVEVQCAECDQVWCVEAIDVPTNHAFLCDDCREPADGPVGRSEFAGG